MGRKKAARPVRIRWQRVVLGDIDAAGTAEEKTATLGRDGVSLDACNDGLDGHVQCGHPQFFGLSPTQGCRESGHLSRLEDVGSGPEDGARSIGRRAEPGSGARVVLACLFKRRLRSQRGIPAGDSHRMPRSRLMQSAHPAVAVTAQKIFGAVGRGIDRARDLAHVGKDRDQALIQGPFVGRCQTGRGKTVANDQELLLDRQQETANLVANQCRRGLDAAFGQVFLDEVDEEDIDGHQQPDGQEHQQHEVAQEPRADRTRRGPQQGEGCHGVGWSSLEAVWRPRSGDMQSREISRCSGYSNAARTG